MVNKYKENPTWIFLKELGVPSVRENIHIIKYITKYKVISTIKKLFYHRSVKYNIWDMVNNTVKNMVSREY